MLAPAGRRDQHLAMDDDLAPWLSQFLGRRGASSGTVHRVDGDLLRLVAAINIPAKVVEATATIPLGKGMAGAAWERSAPVFTCDLPNDPSRDIRPGARAVGARAAVAFPIGEPVRAVVGVAWMDALDLDDAAVAAIMADAGDFPG